MSESDPPDNKTPPATHNKLPSKVEKITPSQDEFPEALRAILKKAGIDEDDPNARVILNEISTLTAYHGPIPPPQMLAEYDSVQPGLAGRIVDSWEGQHHHRQHLEIQTTTGSESRMDKSQRNALIVALLGLLVAGAVGIWGNWIAAAVIAIVAVGGPSAATILARYLPRPRD